MDDIMCHTHNCKCITALHADPGIKSICLLTPYQLLLPFCLCVCQEIVSTKMIFYPKWRALGATRSLFFFKDPDHLTHRRHTRPSFHCSKCSKAISIAAAARCIVEFSWTFRAVNIVKLSETWVLCAHLAGPLCA